MILTAPLINPPRGCPCHQLEKAPHWTGTTKGCHQLWFSGQNQKYFYIQHNFIANLNSQVDWYFVLITTKSWLSIQMLLWTIWNLHIHFSIPLKVSIEEKLQINFGAKTGSAGGNLRPCNAYVGIMNIWVLAAARQEGKSAIICSGPQAAADWWPECGFVCVSLKFDSCNLSSGNYYDLIDRESKNGKIQDRQWFWCCWFTVHFSFIVDGSWLQLLLGSM